MDKKVLKATHEGELILGDKKLSCAVLEDNTRILTASGVFQAFDRPRRGKSIVLPRVDQMPAFLDAINLQPFVSEQLMGWIKLIEYEGLNNTIKYGYDARILRGLCKVYIDARNKNALLKSQEKFAFIAESLLYSLSDIGIAALVDEATGYQYERENNELQKLLKAYILEEFLPWQKRFPDVFYKELFRLNNWDYTVNGIKNRPKIIGKWTNTLIYDELPREVVEELRKRAPKNEKGDRISNLHLGLTLDIGEPHLAAQINQIIAIFRISDNMRDMWLNFNKFKTNKLKTEEKQEKEAPFEFDEKGHTKEIQLSFLPIMDKAKDNDDFDKGIKNIVGYNNEKGAGN